MRRVAITFLVVCLGAVGAAHGALAQSPLPDPTPETPPDTDGQRTEVAEADIAVSFPADWEVRVPMAGPGTIAEEVADPSVEAWLVLVAEAPGYTDESCSLMQLRSSELVLIGFADRYRSWVESAPGWQGTVESTLVGLPVGESVRVETISDETTTDGNAYVGSNAFSVDYLIGSGDAVYSLGCRNLKHPGDDGKTIASRWQSIAETIEFLPAEE